jgi:hypothetical protein
VIKRLASTIYWIITMVAIGLGLLTDDPTGRPFAVVGAVLVVLYLSRAHRIFFWTSLSGVAAFLIGFVLFMPVGCAYPACQQGSECLISCPTLLGFRYEGRESFPLLPAMLLAAICLTAAWFLIGHSARDLSER